jgi:hypothetical protein
MPSPGTGIASSRWTPSSRPPGASFGFILCALPTPSNSLLPSSPPKGDLRASSSSVSMIGWSPLPSARVFQCVIAPGFELVLAYDGLDAPGRWKRATSYGPTYRFNGLMLRYDGRVTHPPRRSRSGPILRGVDKGLEHWDPFGFAVLKQQGARK